MNIFVTDIDSHKCAINLDDKRVSHMPKECFEIISMAICRNTGTAVAPLIIWNKEKRFKDQEKFLELYYHKCVTWAASKRENLWWLWTHAQFLMLEYKHRFYKNHWLFDQFLMIAHYIPISNKNPISFPNCSGFEGSDIFENYKKCLFVKWFITDEIKPVLWTNRIIPGWINSIGAKIDSKAYAPDLFHEVYDPFDDLPF